MDVGTALSANDDNGSIGKMYIVSLGLPHSPQRQCGAEIPARSHAPSVQITVLPGGTYCWESGFTTHT